MLPGCNARTDHTARSFSLLAAVAAGARLLSANATCRATCQATTFPSGHSPLTPGPFTGKKRLWPWVSRRDEYNGGGPPPPPPATPP